MAASQREDYYFLQQINHEKPRFLHRLAEETRAIDMTVQQCGSRREQEREPRKCPSMMSKILGDGLRTISSEESGARGCIPLWPRPSPLDRVVAPSDQVFRSEKKKILVRGGMLTDDLHVQPCGARSHHQHLSEGRRRMRVEM